MSRRRVGARTSASSAGSRSHRSTRSLRAIGPVRKSVCPARWSRSATRRTSSTRRSARALRRSRSSPASSSRRRASGNTRHNDATGRASRPALLFNRRVDDAPVLELRGITKQFPGVLANDHIDFDLRRGEVHALLGENGAGKSTLMSILYGLYTADSGQILMNGKPVQVDSPAQAIELGIGMVHQHFMLIPVMPVPENIVLAQEP